MEIDVQLFRENGTWIKPPGAITVDVVLAGADAAGNGIDISGGTHGMVTGHSLHADELPDEVAVTIGPAGRAGVSTGATGGPGRSHDVHVRGGGGSGVLHYEGEIVASGGPGGSSVFGAGGGGAGSASRPPGDGLAVIITHLAKAAKRRKACKSCGGELPGPDVGNWGPYCSGACEMLDEARQ